MFDDPGYKLKNAAQIEFLIVAIVSVVLAFVLGINDGEFRPLVFFLLLLGGPLLAYLSSLVLYGFGEFVENSEAWQMPIQKKAKKMEESKKNRIKEKAIEEISDSESENGKYIDITCPFCDENLSFTKGDFVEKDFLICPNCEKKIDTKNYTALYRSTKK